MVTPGDSRALSAVPDRLLDAAEALLARGGSAALSVRTVLASADVANASAVGYYFGNRAGLIDAVERRSVERVELARLEALERLQADSSDLTVDQLVTAWMAPIVRLRGGGRGALSARVYTRIFEQPQEKWGENGAHRVLEVTDRFIDAARPLLPASDHADLLWRYQCVTSQAAWYVLGYLDMFADPDEDQIEQDLARLVASGAASLMS